MSKKRNPHFLGSGAPKKVFLDPAEAEAIAQKIQGRDGTVMNHYKCPSTDCPGWHVGRAPTRLPIIKPRVPVYETFEFNARIIGCLRLENIGTPGSRVKAIEGRLNAVKERRLYGDDHEFHQPRRKSSSSWGGIMP